MNVVNTSAPSYLPMALERVVIWRCQSQHCPLTRRDGTSGTLCVCCVKVGDSGVTPTAVYRVQRIILPP